MNNKIKMLNDLRSYENMSNIKYEIAIHKKKQIYDNLKEQALDLKEETEDLTVQYEIINNEMKRFTHLIKENEEFHIKYKEEILNFFAENIKDKINIEKMFNFYKVNKISEIIKIFHNRKYLSNSLQMQIQNLNNALKLRNFEIRKYKKEINFIENYISEKRSDTQISECENDFESINLEAQLKIKRKSNLADFAKFKKFEDFINKMFNKLYQHGIKLDEIISFVHKFSFEKNFKKKIKKILDKSDQPFNELNNVYSFNNFVDDDEQINKGNDIYFSGRKADNFIKFFKYSIDNRENIRKSNFIFINFLFFSEIYS